MSRRTGRFSHFFRLPRGALDRFATGLRAAGEIVALTILLLGPALPAVADDAAAVAIRSGSHRDFGRIVFDAPPGVSYRVVRDGDHLTVQFGDGVTLTGDPRLPRNVVGLHVDHAQAMLTIAAGATFRDARLGDHVVIDVFDPATGASGDATPAAPAGGSSPPPPASPHTAGRSPAAAALPLPLPPPDPGDDEARSTAAMPPSAAGTARPADAVAPAANGSAIGVDPTEFSPANPAAPAVANPAPAAVENPAAPAATNPAAPDANAAAQADPASIVAASVSLPPDTKGAAFLLPFPDSVGAAVFRRRGETLVVFDDHRPIDMTALQSDTTFAQAKAELLPAGALVRLTAPPGAAISVSRTPQGWVVAALAVPPEAQPLTPHLDDALVNIAARQPGGVVAIADPATGGTLLIGTQRQSGQGMLEPRNTPQFVLLPTTLGVAVAPLADSVALRTVPNGFALSTAPDPLAMSRDDAQPLGDPATLTRRFEFPSQPTDQLMRQLSADTADAAAVPLLARGPKRRAAALAMISLGMGAEAEALLQLTAADDPRQAASTEVIGLTAIAAMLANRPAEAEGIDNQRLNGTDEVVLWRALRMAMLDDASPVAAIALANAAPLLLSYPPAIRDRMLPIAVETMIRGGANSAATALLERAKGLPGLGMARGMLAQATGDTKGALARYDALAAGPDDFASARAAVRAVELRLTTGEYDTRQAAEALDRLLYAWRGDQRELALREKLSGLRQQLGEWRQALSLLRDSETMFPDDVKDIRARLQTSFDALLHDGAMDKLPPLEFVALVDENADLVPDTREGVVMQTILADKLLALDLPNRAGPVLDKLMRTVPAGPGRAAIGARLATLRLREFDAGGAMAALAASDAPDLPAAMSQQRAILLAEAQARKGDVNAAVGTLAAVDSVAAIAARAGILEQAKDWTGAEHALADYVAKTVPDAGALNDDSRRLLLRFATAAARAGDQVTLAGLRERQEARMGTGPLAEMFRLLTADPVQNTADLNRVGREVGYARALSGDLQAMRP